MRDASVVTALNRPPLTSVNPTAPDLGTETRIVRKFVAISVVLHVIAFVVSTLKLIHTPPMPQEEFGIETELISDLNWDTTAKTKIPDVETAPEAAAPSDSQGTISIPENVTIFGKNDPNVRRATALVNGDIITGTDVDQRLALILAANDNKVSPEEKERLRLQVLRNLIDETLQIQEAKANEITVEPKEVDQAFGRVARNYERTPEQMRGWLRQMGSSERSIKRQIEGELAWSRLLRRRVDINVSEEEANARIQEAMENARQEIENYVETAADFIRQRPVVCVAAAIGIGFLIGKIASRR